MLTRSSEYAIRALVYIQLQNWGEIRPRVDEIAREIEAPVAFCAKILQTLAKHRLLESMKGRGGGFFFRDNQSDLSLLDVIRVMEGDAIFHQCGFGLKNCSESNPCPLHEKYKVLRDGYYEIVKHETISSLAKKILAGEATLNRVHRN